MLSYRNMFDVATIGSAARDVFLGVDFETIRWDKTESRRAYVLPLGEKLEARNFFPTIGGNAANAAVTFGRQGFKTACAAEIGRDASGEEIKRRLRKEDVETEFLRFHPTRPTSYSVLILEKGERTIINYRGAADFFRLPNLNLNRLKSRWWYVSLAGESDRMLKGLLNFARKNNTSVAFNPSGHHIRHRRAEILSSLKDISFLVLNEEEASLLTGISFKNERAVFKKLDKLMPGILAVTSGKGGATISDGKYIYKAGIFRERKLVDRTGAGDAFGSGFVAGLIRQIRNPKFEIRNLSPEAVKYAIRLASANATSVVEKIGATEGILTKKEFDKDKRWRDLRIEVKRL